MSLTIGRVWLVECQRCANEDVSFEESANEATIDLSGRGWSDDFCPACNGVSR